MSKLRETLRGRMIELRKLMLLAPAVGSDAGRELIGDAFIDVIIGDVLRAYGINRKAPDAPSDMDKLVTWLEARIVLCNEYSRQKDAKLELVQRARTLEGAYFAVLDHIRTGEGE